MTSPPRPQLTPLKAIRKHCLACMGGSRKEVAACTAAPDSTHSCTLWVYRMGHNPRRAGIGGRRPKKLT